MPALRLILVSLVTLAGGCGGGAAPELPTPHPPARDLVFMRRLQPITMSWQTAAVRTDGTGVKSDFVGERSLVKRPVRLSPAALARLRREVGRLHGPLPRPHGRPPRTAMIYTVRLGGRAVVAVGGRLPPRLAPVIRSLNRVIERYAAPGR